MKNTTRFEFGDRVRHGQRPEWGIGTVMKAEETRVDGQSVQRISVRFPNAGVKTLSTLHADLERVGGTDAEPPAAERETVAAWESMEESGWLAPMARKKIEEIMIGLPPEVRDPFRGLRQRLKAMLDLYRFDRSGRGLVDWAVAQSGLDDPLSRFTRQELEQHFDRWCFERDGHLRRLVQEARNGTLLRELLESAPAAARHAVQRISAQR